MSEVQSLFDRGAKANFGHLGPRGGMWSSPLHTAVGLHGSWNNRTFEQFEISYFKFNLFI